MTGYLDLQKELEEKAFRRKWFIRERMQKYGFAENADGFVIKRDIMDGDFTALILVDNTGRVASHVIDNMNDEEYLQMRSPTFMGSYVNTVRDAYGKLLEDIAEKCCVEVGFAYDQSNRIAERILDEFGVEPDCPWEQDENDPYASYGVFRHKDSGKWFGLIMDVAKGKLDKNKDGTHVDVINLKADEEAVPELCKEDGIYPAWHMNHKKWISVLLDDTLSDERVMQLIRGSFILTAAKPGKMDEDLIREVLALADSVPEGRVVSYGQLARMVGREKNSRMVGKIMSMADRYGDHPCHRVVNSAGRTVPGWTEQRGLLEAEGVRFKANGCVDMNKYRWDPADKDTVNTDNGEA